MQAIIKANEEAAIACITGFPQGDRFCTPHWQMREVVQAKYRDLFRSKLDVHGRPVPYSTFRRYAVEVLRELDADPSAQEMILESWIAEAESGRALFHCTSFASASDEQYIANIPFSPDMVYGDEPVKRLPHILVQV